MAVKTKQTHQREAVPAVSEKYIGVRCDDEFYKRLVRRAQEDRRSLSAMLRVLAEKQMDSEQLAASR